MQPETKKEAVETRIAELKVLRAKQEELIKRLETEFDKETYRELNCINQKIRVRESQIKGDWTKNQLLNYSTF